MKSLTLLSTLLVATPLALAAPTPAPATSNHLSQTLPSVNTEKDDSKRPWIVYSLREQPFEDAELTFQFMDPVSKYETECRTDLPMSGYATCSDGTTSFIYGGVSFQYGETWLSIQRRDVDDCTETTTTSAEGAEKKQDCKKRSASGTLNLPSNFWQQPGWNSWVHPETMDMNWGWSS